jgi:hypothetical protein
VGTATSSSSINCCYILLTQKSNYARGFSYLFGIDLNETADEDFGSVNNDHEAGKKRKNSELHQ